MDNEQKLDTYQEAMKLLNFWVLDERKIVTSSLLLKNTSLNVSEVQRLLNDFMEQNVTDERVSSTFLLLGQPCSSVDDVVGVERMKSTVCRQEELEQTKERFESIDTCSIYSVQSKYIKDYQSLFNVDWSMDDELFISDAKDKALLWNPIAYSNYARWKESRQDEANRLENMSKHMIQKEMLRAAKEDPQKSKSKDVNMESMFKSKIKSSPKKKVQAVETISPSPQAKRFRKVLIDEDEEEESDKEPDSLERKDEGMETDAQASAVQTSKLFDSDPHDLYCTGGDSSPEKSTVPVTKGSGKKVVNSAKQTKEKKTSKATHSANVISTEQNDDEVMQQTVDANIEITDSQPRTITTFKKEKVTESYVDDNGYTVTKTVPKFIETDEVILPRPQKPVLKASNTTNSKLAKSKVPQNQPSISSFFKKS